MLIELSDVKKNVHQTCICFNIKILKCGRGPSQDDPFDIILWYTAKNSYFVGKRPIHDIELI